MNERIERVGGDALAAAQVLHGHQRVEQRRLGERGEVEHEAIRAAAAAVALRGAAAQLDRARLVGQQHRGARAERGVASRPEPCDRVQVLRRHQAGLIGRDVQTVQVQRLSVQASQDVR